MSADAGELSPLIETVVTTTGRGGEVNCAAMGVRWGEEELVFWPFHTTRTLRNLRRHGEAVVHLTDDVLLFVQAALGHPRPAVRPASAIEGSVIEEANAWREIVVTEIAPDAGDAAAVAGASPGGRLGHRRPAAAGPLPRPARRRRSVDHGVAAAVAGTPSTCRPSSAACRSWWTGPPGPASAPRWTTSGATWASTRERDRGHRAGAAALRHARSGGARAPAFRGMRRGRGASASGGGDQPPVR